MCAEEDAVPTGGKLGSSTSAWRWWWARAWASWLAQVGGRPSAVVRWFMPFWFTVCMGTGMLSACLARMPYDVAAIRWTGVGLFALNAVLLVAFLVVLVVQAVVYPETWAYMRRHPQRMLHYGAVPMALATAVTGTLGFGFHEAHRGVLYAAWAAWWVAVALAWAAAVLLVYLAASRATRSIEAVTGAWLLLVAPLTVCATAGAALAESLAGSAAYATLVCSYVLAGAGVPLTCCVVVLYMHRIAAHKLPPSDAILTAFIPLGPVAQAGVAALALGSAAQDLLPQALPASAEALAPVLYGLGVAAALAAWGSALFWAAHAVFCVAYQHHCCTTGARVPFGIGWWALTFPVGVFAMLTAALGDALELPAFRVFFVLLVALLLGLWLVIVARTAAGLCTGAIFDIPGLIAMDDDSNDSDDSSGELTAATSSSSSLP
ncbi:Plasma membrane sulfite pump involved in sulfite metabolism [Coemansia sp. RSA 2424]|nr:Plasma membrane sulfite pump involved in sulfite metabolism [Coemansia sp. RSA 2424]